MKNLYFLCLAKQNFKLTVLSKGYILQFSFDPLFIKLLFKEKKQTAIKSHHLHFFIFSYHSSSKLYFDIFCDSMYTGKFLLWWGSAMMMMPHKIPSSSWYCLSTIRPEYSAGMGLSLELYPKKSLVSPCHILWMLWKLHFITWVLNN